MTNGDGNFRDLEGRVAIVTGASMGLGSVMAHALAQHGVTVIGIARNKDKLETFGAQLNESLGRSAFHALAGGDACERAVSFALARFSRLDIVINNAGVAERVNNNETAGLRD